jgi:hypothetical protein
MESARMKRIVAMLLAVTALDRLAAMTSPDFAVAVPSLGMLLSFMIGFGR